MRALIHLMLLFAVALCGSHVAEPVQAHSGATHHAFAEAAHSHEAPVGDDREEQRGDEAAHANAHHCPLAAGARSPDGSCLQVRDIDPVAPPIRALDSRALAPPEEPPLR